MSYRKKHIKSKIHRIKPKESVFRKLWFWIITLLIIIILSAIYFVFFYSGLQIKNIVISGNSKIATQDLQQLVRNNADTELINFWNIKIISKSIFLVSGARIDKDILKNFSAVESVSVRKILPQTLILDVVERKPIGVFCQTNVQCFSIDQSGIIFEPLGAVPAGATIVRQSAGSGQIASGQEVVSQNIMSAIYQVQKNLKDDFQINVKEALVANSARLNITTDENWQVYFNLNSGTDISLQLTKLNLLLNGEISALERKNLKYIDLRPKDRAIICDNQVCSK